MTENEVNIAIAEACGYYYMDNVWRYPNGAHADKLPSYCHDLNAMHEAEKTLSDVRAIVYRTFLAVIVEDDTTNRYSEPAFATARQRAEAFLIAIRRWEEKKFDFS